MTPPAWWLRKHQRTLAEGATGRGATWPEEKTRAFVEAWNRGDSHNELGLAFGIAPGSIPPKVAAVRSLGHHLRPFPSGRSRGKRGRRNQ